ncbi:MAG: questin oxidase family protein [Glaciimonas sp.]|nr:questin oxidase family protein [Glaciimonas sp.]
MHKISSNVALYRLLAANASSALDERHFTNHCPMALCALAAMGANAMRLQVFFDEWKLSFKTITPHFDQIIDQNSWPRYLGNIAAFGALRVYFEEWIEKSSVNTVLEQVFRQIPFAPASAAFHGMIRLAYGLEAEHNSEIAAGLAILVSGHLPINIALADRALAASVEDGLAALSQCLNGVVPTGNSITTHLRAVVADPRFHAQLLTPPTNPDLINEMARTAIALYWQTNDFTALHMVTGLNATRSVFTHLPEVMAQQLLPDLWIAFCAAYASIGAPPLTIDKNISTTHTSDSAAWSALHALAITADNDHVIKMVYTCWRENQRETSPLYYAAAARLVLHDNG